MDRLVGCLDFSKPGKCAKAAIAQMTAPMEDKGPDLLEDCIAEDNFALSAQSFNQTAADWRLIWSDHDVLFYLSGYIHVDGSTIFTDTAEDSIADISRKIYKSILTGNKGRLASLSGSFLILFYDLKGETLSILTDKLGSRPLFYARKGGTFIFATELQALLQNSEICPSLDLLAVTEYLRLGMVFEDRTLYEAIKSIPPASILNVDRKGVCIEPYWTMTFDESWNQPDSYYIDALIEGFKTSILRLTGDFNTAALMLSGGLDSRMMAASLLTSGVKVQVVSFGGFENDEVRIARAVAKECDFPFSFLKRDPNSYNMVFPKAVEISSGLFHFYHAHMLGLHAQVHTLEIKTLLHGWGLDLLFSATYLPKRTINHLPGRSFNLIWPRSFNDQKDVVEGLHSKLVLPIDNLTERLPGKSLKDIWNNWPREIITGLVETAKDHGEDYYNRYEWVLLQDVSRFRSFLFPLSIRWGCKERCPLYDSQVFEVYLSMPPRLRICSRAYRRALKALAVPLAKIPYARTGISIRSPEVLQTGAYFLLPTIQAIRLGKRRLTKRHEDYPEECFNSYPVTGILFRQADFRSIAQDLFSSGALGDLGLVKPEVLEKMLEHHYLGLKNYGDELSGLLSLACWLTN